MSTKSVKSGTGRKSTLSAKSKKSATVSGVGVKKRH